MTQDKTESVLSHVVLNSLPPEPAATQALEFILRNPEARQAFVSLFNLQSVLVGSTRVMSEVTLEEDARPDLVIYDSEDNPRLLVENKFWAGLTDAQPVRYLENLPDDGIDSLLVFVVPKTRSTIIWRELIQRCEDAGINVPIVDNHSEVILTKLTCGNRHIGVTNWEYVLATLINVPKVQEDVRQLRALTDRMDAEAFLPIHPEELLNVGLARRLMNYADLAERVVEELKHRQVGDKDGLQAASSIYYSGTYLRMKKKLEVWLGLDFDLWQENGTTPMWCRIQDTLLNHAQASMHRLEDEFPGTLDRNGWQCIPIRLKTGVESDRVVEDATDQMIEIADLILENSID